MRELNIIFESKRVETLFLVVRVFGPLSLENQMEKSRVCKKINDICKTQALAQALRYACFRQPLVLFSAGSSGFSSGVQMGVVFSMAASMPIGVEARLNLTVRCALGGASLTLSVTEACHGLDVWEG